MKIGRKAALFTVGGGAYVALELLYRRRSHVSMFAAGGICFLTLGKLRSAFRPYPVKIAAGAIAVTAVELTAGLIINRDHRIWDYRDLPGNFRGQICPQFTAVWMILSAVGMELYGLADRLLSGENFTGVLPVSCGHFTADLVQ